MSLHGRLAVVTGASRGIGRAIAVTLARAGALVVGCSLHGQADGRAGFLDDLSGSERARCRLLRCDVRRGEQVEHFAAEVIGAGHPYLLVNNAGTVARGAFTELSEETWDDVVASNLKGTFLVTRALLPSMVAAGQGRIVNIASIAGRQGTAMLTAYCAAKHAVVGLTRALAEELRGSGIPVNAVCPGSVDTDMLKVGMPGGEPRMTPDEVARVVLFLASAAPPAMTGSCIDVFG